MAQQRTATVLPEPQAANEDRTVAGGWKYLNGDEYQEVKEHQEGSNEMHSK